MATISILYDGRAQADLRPGWGFSAWISVGDESVLFDTGADKLIFEGNARALGCNLSTLGALVLSHEHCDHIGAVSAVTRKGLRLYAPASSKRRFAGHRKGGVQVIAVRGPEQVCPGVKSTGQFGRKTREQALLVDGTEGPALVTGCAHPGIVAVANLATKLAGRPPALIVGGFHLYRNDEAEVRYVAEQLLRLGVERIAPCHCTGDAATAILRDAYGEGFVEVSAGNQVRV
ncbi:MAG: MBL fold metallo-hydrolase [Candidatus Bipolaricaulis sp.]|nr:MBL fold metallo-hydrolase [Candidatus Bipolaricaulis sp.]